MEILVTVSILTIVSGVTFGAMRIYDISLSMGTTKAYLSAQANQALSKMVGELGLSSKARVYDTATLNPSPPPAYNVPFSEGVLVSEIAFMIPLKGSQGIDALGNIVWGDGGESGTNLNGQLKYYVGTDSKPNQFIRDNFSSGGGLDISKRRILANDISSVQFTLSGNSLTITVIASKAMQRGNIPALSVPMSARVDFRN
ncbi:MAG: hypothetical protein Q8L26_05500 [Candidatus Omnitrophota bacterium]|nr:hypothetical protein [Candidatus Omnitrophota bacterium]